MSALHFASWPPAYVFPFFVAGLMLYQSIRMDTGWRVAVVSLTFITGFCWGQAAGFHVGPYANAWGISSLVPFFLSGITGYFGSRSSQRNQFRSVGDTIVGRGVSLRAASIEDLDLLAEWFADPRFVVWWGGSPKSRIEVATKYLATRPDKKAFIVESDGEPVGYVQAWSDTPPDGGIDIVLKPEAQGKGMGTDAVRTLALHLKAAGWRRITIDPLSDNVRAIRSFEKAGFVRDRINGKHLVLVYFQK